MNLLDKIDKITLNETSYPIYGRKKSQEYLKFRQKVFDATTDTELTVLMKQMEVAVAKKKISIDEMMDLIDKIDQKKMSGGGRVKGMEKIDKFTNKVKNK